LMPLWSWTARISPKCSKVSFLNIEWCCGNVTVRFSSRFLQSDECLIEFCGCRNYDLVFDLILIYSWMIFVSGCFILVHFNSKFPVRKYRIVYFRTFDLEQKSGEMLDQLKIAFQLTFDQSVGAFWLNFQSIFPFFSEMEHGRIIC